MALHLNNLYQFKDILCFIVTIPMAFDTTKVKSLFQTLNSNLLKMPKIWASRFHYMYSIENLLFSWFHGIVIIWLYLAVRGGNMNYVVLFIRVDPGPTNTLTLKTKSGTPQFSITTCIHFRHYRYSVHSEYKIRLFKGQNLQKFKDQIQSVLVNILSLHPKSYLFFMINLSLW
jgi:hypothetical protein